MNNPFNYRPDNDCTDGFRALTEHIEALKRSNIPEDIRFCRELSEGKMLGVLIAEDPSGVRHKLYAFSGQVSDGGFHFPGFVGPVFDYLQPDGYFRRHEMEISRQNREIADYENGGLRSLSTELESIKHSLREEVDGYREECRKAKSARKVRRESGLVGDDELSAMIRQSQYEKAELRRRKMKMAEALRPYEERLSGATNILKGMKEKRRGDSEALQNWLFENFQLLNGNGETRSLKDIFAETSTKVPPSGAGECCAPKLLQAAYVRGWRPVSIAEYWYGAPKNGEIRRHGEFYPACRGKCLPVLRWMLQGLEVNPPLDEEIDGGDIPEPEILYENEWFCIVNKPSGMLSVPGKGKAISVQSWLEERYGPDRFVRPVHRLDQDTSGLIIAALDESAFKLLQSMFERRKMEKRYVAVLDGDYKASGIRAKGVITLPIAPDRLDRPRQRVDSENGKEAVTEYEFTGVENGRSRVIFYPKTGRTHQLRVHSASEGGLGMPIVGDRLYGHQEGSERLRMMLHADKISFLWPLDNRRYEFESPVPFCLQP